MDTIPLMIMEEEVNKSDLKYQLDINNKPCNFVELIPRLKEK